MKLRRIITYVVLFTWLVALSYISSQLELRESIWYFSIYAVFAIASALFIVGMFERYEKEKNG